MNKFTPGKWKYFDLYGIIGTDTDGIARVYHAGKETLTAEGQANARLIAEAPAMYELLKECADELAGDLSQECFDLIARVDGHD